MGFPEDQEEVVAYTDNRRSRSPQRSAGPVPGLRRGSVHIRDILIRISALVVETRLYPAPGGLLQRSAVIVPDFDLVDLVGDEISEEE